MKPRIVLFDIETSPTLGWYFGSKWQTNILKNERDWHLLSFAYKVLGENKVHYCGLNEMPGYRPGGYDDTKLAKELWKVLDEADIVIAHNGDQFDVKMSNVRFLAAGLTPPRPYRTIDTKKIAKKEFRFTSNSLDDLAKHFGFEGKTPHTGKQLWFDCMDGDPKAWSLMKKYNIQDVALLERVYLYMRPWATSHPNMGAYEEIDSCRNCASKRLQKRGVRVTQTGKIQTYHCQDCGAYSQGKATTVVTIR